MWCGQFSNREQPAADKLQKHSGLLCADLDELGPELETVREKLKTSCHLSSLFLSPSGIGLKAVFRVPADGAKHPGSFRAVEKHVRELTGVPVDQKCKDPARLCFMSYDAEIYVNENAREIESLPEPEKPRPALESSSEVNLSERQRIATEVLGNIDWTSETSGYPVCPGKHLHTTGDGVRDCKIELDGVPTVHCFHNHCRGILEGVNHELRSRIGKAEFVQTPSDQAQPRNSEPGFELPAAPEPYVPPPLDLLPGALQDYVHAAAESLNVDISFILLPLLSALGSAIGNSRSILLKDNFIQPPVIWTGIVGRSGSRKSPSLNAACLPVMEYEHELVGQNKIALEIYQDELLTWEQTKKSHRGAKPQPPVLLTCLVDDLTMASLAEKIETNPRGLLVCKDELAHWFAAMDQFHDAKGIDVNRWLSLHTGVFLAVDRKAHKESFRLWFPRVCIAGGIQPMILARVLTADFFERGLPARFLFAAPPGRKDRWSENTISSGLTAALLKLFNALYELEPERKNEKIQPKLLCLDPDAKAIFVRYYNACGDAAIEGDERAEASWSKLSGYAARLALVGQLVRDSNSKLGTGEVMQSSCELAKWFGAEAIRIYATFTETPERREQRRLIEFIASRGGHVRIRDLMQSYTPLKNKRDKAETYLNALVKARYGEWESVPTTARGGKPTREFLLLRPSTSTKPYHLRGKTGGIVDVDGSITQKITPSREPNTEAETLAGDKLGVARL